MKKLLATVISILFMAGIFAVPTMAGVFDEDIIKCGVPRAPNTTSDDGCGSNPPATDPLQQGKVVVVFSGEVVVELQGAAPNKTYLVVVGNWLTGDSAQPQFNGTGTVCHPFVNEIGSITTDGSGNFAGHVTTPAGDTFSFPSGTRLGQPNFAFNDPDCVKTQFTTGFAVR